MYDHPFDTLTRIGWALALVVALLLAALAGRTECRLTHPARTSRARALDTGLRGAAAAAVVAFVGVLILEVLTTFLNSAR